MNQPSPAIVTQGAVRRLPRAALWLFCVAYLLPGFVGRAPWRSDDITAFGVMLDLAQGQSNWLAPRLMGIAPEIDALLPYWLGAWALQLAPSWIAPDFAARLPFMAMLGLTLVAVWEGTYYLARSPQAQPVAFAFGGEASAPEYARAMADGGLLAFIACLGLAQISHETTPALAQLCFTSLTFFAVAAMPYHRLVPALSAATGLVGLTLSGGPTMAVLLGAGSLLIHLLDTTPATLERRHKRSGLWLLAVMTLGVAMLATFLHLWVWRIELPRATWSNWKSLGTLLLWFTWPASPLVLWTLWRWRHQLLILRVSRHLSLPLWLIAIALGATLVTQAADRSLLLALPALAALAAFALPTLSRSVAALIDWFTLIFFTNCALVIWVVWIAMQTGVPPQPAANVARLAPGFESRFVILPFVFAVLATLAWAWLVKWRIGRHRAAIWKSLVLSAGGAALCWLLLTTLWMPLLDYARSYVPLVRRIEAVAGADRCIQTFGLPPGLMAALKFHTPLVLHPPFKSDSCPWLVVDLEAYTANPAMVESTRWKQHSSLGHPREGEEDVVIFQRKSAASGP